MLTVDVSDVPGDVAAEARLVITDASSEARRWVEWGIEQRYYDPDSPPALFIDGASLTPYAGAGTALSGAYGGSVVSTTLFSQPAAICDAGIVNMTHIGSYRVKARVWCASTDEYWRFVWQEGDGDATSNSYVQPVAGSAFNELDLGVITIQEVQAGSQNWSALVEAYTTTADGEMGAVDYLALIPDLESYGRLEAVYSYQPGYVLAHDEFTTLASGSALDGRVATLGGTWSVTGGSANMSGGVNNVIATGTDHATLDEYDFVPTEVGVAFVAASSSYEAEPGVIARYTDSNNYLGLYYSPSAVEGNLALVAVISGTAHSLAITVTPGITLPSSAVGGHSGAGFGVYAQCLRGLGVGAVRKAWAHT